MENKIKIQNITITQIKYDLIRLLIIGTLALLINIFPSVLFFDIKDIFDTKGYIPNFLLLPLNELKIFSFILLVLFFVTFYNLKRISKVDLSDYYRMVTTTIVASSVSLFIILYLLYHINPDSHYYYFLLLNFILAFYVLCLKPIHYLRKIYLMIFNHS